ncbi:folt-1 [Pristionchus pacificus]|uniref:Folt-1 n=1 Tax=Pristionchus pacificus TaxID=54126 RepID=A0A2A6C822_PRIPA|nr:folt-1 [Pristionchus pacificus]|eukprot:PDM74309.1 folt-1 [Pristionchus pacificus]
MHWKATTVLICVYGIVKEFRPATPFLTPFLVSDYKNLTKEVVYGDIYPYWTYSYFFVMIPIFFLTDVLRYKPIIILEAATLTGTWALLVWGQGVRQMQLMQIIFGLSSAAEVAYYSYMYAIVDERNYKRVSSYIRSSAMIGKLVAFSLAQFLVSTNTGSYLLLNQISLAAVALVTVIAFFLPPVPTVKVDKQTRIRAVGGSIRSKEDEESEEHEPLRHGGLFTLKTSCPIISSLSRNAVERAKMSSGVRMYFSLTFRSLEIYRTSPAVLKWSVWWALAACGYYQISNYSQTLWISMQPDVDHVQNGIALIANTLMGAILSFGMQYLSIDWGRWGGPTLAASSLIIAALQLTAACTDQVYLAYACYVGTSAIYHMLITAACFNIASLLTSANYGLVFGVNTFVALILQTALTFAIADSHGFNLDIRTQFVIYACYFAMVSLVFIISIIVSCFRKSISPSIVAVSRDEIGQ